MHLLFLISFCFILLIDLENYCLKILKKNRLKKKIWCIFENVDPRSSFLVSKQLFHHLLVNNEYIYRSLRIFSFHNFLHFIYQKLLKIFGHKNDTLYVDVLMYIFFSLNNDKYTSYLFLWSLVILSMLPW